MKQEESLDMHFKDRKNFRFFENKMQVEDNKKILRDLGLSKYAPPKRVEIKLEDEMEQQKVEANS